MLFRSSESSGRAVSSLFRWCFARTFPILDCVFILFVAFQRNQSLVSMNPKSPFSFFLFVLYLRNLYLTQDHNNFYQVFL